MLRLIRTRLPRIALLVGAGLLAAVPGSDATFPASTACGGSVWPPIRDPTSTPEPALTAHLAVLRRAQRPSDEGPVQLREGLSLLTRLDRIAVGGIRYLGRAALGARFYLLPAAIRDPFACEPQRPRFEPLAAQIELRTHTVGAALAVVMRHSQHEAILYDEGALYEDLAANRVIAYFDAPGNHSATLAGVVPDGVRAVHVSYSTKATTVRVPAGANFWSARVPAPRRGLDFRFVWLGTAHHVLGRFTGIREAIY